MQAKIYLNANMLQWLTEAEGVLKASWVFSESGNLWILKHEKKIMNIYNSAFLILFRG